MKLWVNTNDALEENLLLDTFTQIHQYNTSGNVVYCHTGLVENAMYELTWQSSGGSANIDFALFPAGRRGGANVFRSQYKQLKMVMQTLTLPTNL